MPVFINQVFTEDKTANILSFESLSIIGTPPPYSISVLSNSHFGEKGIIKYNQK